MGKDVTPFVFDWQKHSTEHRSFLGWLLPTLLAGEPLNEYMDEISERTKQFSDVQITVSINGFEVDAQHFFESVERNMESGAKDQARRMLDEVGGLEQLEERIGEIRKHLIGELENALQVRGIELPSEEW